MLFSGTCCLWNKCNQWQIFTGICSINTTRTCVHVYVCVSLCELVGVQLGKHTMAAIVAIMQLSCTDLTFLSSVVQNNNQSVVWDIYLEAHSQQRTWFFIIIFPILSSLCLETKSRVFTECVIGLPCLCQRLTLNFTVNCQSSRSYSFVISVICLLVCVISQELVCLCGDTHR